MRIADAISPTQRQADRIHDSFNQGKGTSLPEFHFRTSRESFPRQHITSLPASARSGQRGSAEYFLSRGNVSDIRLIGIIRGMINEIASRNRGKSTFLIIDDTLAKKCGDRIDGTGWYYDHAKKIHVLGQKMVLGILVVGIRLPIEALLQLREKENTTTLFKRVFELALAFHSLANLLHCGILSCRYGE